MKTFLGGVLQKSRFAQLRKRVRKSYQERWKPYLQKNLWKLRYVHAVVVAAAACGLFALAALSVAHITDLLAYHTLGFWMQLLIDVSGLLIVAGAIAVCGWISGTWWRNMFAVFYARQKILNYAPGQRIGERQIKKLMRCAKTRWVPMCDGSTVTSIAIVLFLAMALLLSKVFPDASGGIGRKAVMLVRCTVYISWTITLITAALEAIIILLGVISTTTAITRHNNLVDETV